MKKFIGMAAAAALGAAAYCAMDMLCCSCSPRKRVKKLLRRTGHIMYGAGTVMRNLSHQLT